MTEYRVPPRTSLSRREDQRIRLALWGAVFVLVIITVFAVLGASKASSELNTALAVTAALIVMGTVGSAYLLSWRNGVERAKRNVVFLLTEKELIAERVGWPDVRIALSEIKTLHEQRERLVVESAERGRFIAIPNEVVGYDNPGQMSHLAFIRRFTRLPDTLANRKAAEPSEQHRTRGGSMLSVQTENIGEMAVIECEGRIVRSEAALKLRQAVLAQRLARIIVLDLSEVSAIEGGGLGMLVSLQRWAQDHDIRLKLFNPHESVRGRLEQANSMRQFDLATLDEMMAILVWAGRRYARAA